LDSLEDKMTSKEVKQALEHFKEQQPGSGNLHNEIEELLSRAYQQATERIFKQRSGFRRLATYASSWIVCSYRPLTALELQHALATDDISQELDIKNIPDIGDILSVCLGLLTLDQESSTVRLVHYSAQEYFTRTQAIWAPGAQSMLSTTCIAYLMSSGRVDTAELTPGDIEHHVASHQMPFYGYAAQFWGLHRRRSPPADMRMAL
jgi:hypothetical protein